jgi:hypothetical protein
VRVEHSQSAARGDAAWLLVSGDTALWRNPKPHHPGIAELLAEVRAYKPSSTCFYDDCQGADVYSPSRPPPCARSERPRG